MSQKSRHPSAPSTERLCSGGCGRPAFDNFFLCHGCGDELWRQLLKVCQPVQDAADAPGRTLLDELQITIAGVDRLGNRNIGITVRSSETALPWKEHAADALRHLHDVLRSWVHTISGYHGIALDIVTTPLDSANWLLRYHRLIRTTDIAGQAYGEILEAIQRAEWAIDRPPERLFTGACGAVVDDLECTQYLYADADQERVRCRACGSEWFVEERRKWLVRVAETSRALTATVMAGLFTNAGVPVTAAQIRSYASRGRIEPYDYDERDHPRYLIDDVRQALTDRYKHRQAV